MQHPQCQFPRVLLANALGNVLPLQTQDSAVTRANRRATEKSASSRTTLSKIPRHRRVAEAFTTPAYLVIGWPFIVDYWAEKGI